jgi:hypothetical protein
LARHWSKENRVTNIGPFQWKEESKEKEILTGPIQMAERGAVNKEETKEVK